jgi:hypothetical protein
MSDDQDVDGADINATDGDDNLVDHPTNGACKRCGQHLHRLWISNPFTKSGFSPELWCSDHCYAVELMAVGQRICRARRLAAASTQPDTRREDDEQ